MLVRNWMSPTVITVDAEDTMDRALKIMRENKIRLLPVVSKGRLSGVLTDGDLKRASASDATTLDIHELLYLISRITVSRIMSKKPITVPSDFTIEETAEILLKEKISGVPVLGPDGDVVGVITQTDIFRALISLTGIGKRGIQFAFRITDRPGSIKALTDIIRAYGGRMASILSSYDGEPEGKRKVFLRVYGIDRNRLPQLLTELRVYGALRYMVDHASNQREIFE
ncbi:MAG: CBS and ACT domain-containing protein [Pseudomonadota bacterium]